MNASTVPTPKLHCYACKQTTPIFHYLCEPCLSGLSLKTQDVLLERRNASVLPLLRALFDQIDQAVPLRKIRIEVTS